MNKKTTFDWKFILFLITFLALTIGIFIFVNRYNEEQASFVKEAKEKGLIEKSEKEKRLEEEEKERLEEERKRLEEERIQKELETGALLPGCNFARKAESYAYDTKEIRMITRGEKEYAGEKVVFLTFDDGVNTSITPLVLDVLKEKNVPATFFVVGGNLTEEIAPIFKREIAEGHGVALHSQTHDYTHLYPGRVADVEAIRQEALDTQQACKNLLGDDFHSAVFRYPGGHMSWNEMEPADLMLEQNNIQWIDWNCLVGDAEPEGIRPTTAEEMMDFLKMTIKNAGNPDVLVVLMHDAIGKNLTLETLPQIIDYFKAEGFKFGILK